MSVFEDLIDELKNENLLEDTVINLSRADAAARDNGQAAEPKAAAASAAIAGRTSVEAAFQADVPQIEKPASDHEFFRKRAMDEVSSLQMVEHVFSGVEREHMKVASAPFDDLNAKKALHKFLQVSGNPNSPEHAEAEFALRQETESWNLALYARDQKISVANIRRFCEESRPVLSSQALIAMARFYRNSPFTEDVRGKFDYVMTRLFSRDAGEETRRPLFAHAEMIGHINTLYANWSSIALYTSQDDQTEVSLTVLRFDEYTVEVERAESFDALLESDFFNRVRVYKEESAEMYYVPEVLAAAIKCNLSIGNRYVELMGRERQKRSAAKIEEKYGVAYDQIVSNAAGKTLLLTDVLALELDIPEIAEPERSAQPGIPTLSPSRPRLTTRQKDGPRFDLFGVNKWLMAVCMALILVGGGIYIWAEKFAGGNAEAVAAQTVEIDDPEIKKFLRRPSFTNETLFAVTQPSFETLSEDERKALLGKVLQVAQDRGLQKVNLLNSKGRSVAFASKDRIELNSH
jgi:hypothetical protein